MRVAVINYADCKPDKCRVECVNFCPVNRSGTKAIELVEAMKGKPVIYEETCIGCGICVKKCPFDAISIVNLPDALEGEAIHRYGINGFKLFGLPTPKRGAITAIIGKNGTGKTTILKILSGELVPNFGDPEVMPTQDMVLQRFRGKEIHSYFKELYNKELRVVHKVQYVEVVGRLLKGKVSDLLRRIDERGKLDEIRTLLRMESMWEKESSTLSGGELQKLLVGAALLREADVYVFDEPSSYLDINERLNLSRVLRQLLGDKYVLMVDHDLIVLDYVADLVNVMYGEPSIYGRVSKSYSVRAGINHMLKGFLPSENVKMRDYEIRFYMKDLAEMEGVTGTSIKISWSGVQKSFLGFSLSAPRGEVREGEVVGIVGPNGIGKTTFVKILVGELKADAGIVEPEKSRLAYKPQVISPFTERTVREVMEDASKDSLSSSSWFYVEVVRRFGLHKLLDSSVSSLSGGELQKLMIAKTLAKEADVYVFDEPSAYIDVEERYVMARAIKRVTRERRSATLIVEHDLAIHDYVADRIIVFSGKPGVSGNVEEPVPLRHGLNKFLREFGITFRRDAETGRPRANKPMSYLDRLQKERNEYYAMELSGE
ncbi:ribosome biogenesis/translation initiation ATPase RLI [Sulfodiicoccus acidiphilus]|uniref:Ribosome biogenesis/translation initiation ATPase RLI n=1 Tax=Sulfodiicoccus acidiphilus TaxID=1670455 RepID=A0A348B0I6_9CREN|nr:ribosome biogenesis/translation initiation ATPase RLI [Sulfodiicoccus acidiphilus]BBD71688.1 ribosome biogenesis/translation initiation ATPase RLI [Sulfodiicoccus acidiphilus]GGT86593.1 ribosome biogenesis/translation initiation ATPase RLI [Sulfodiicoccus acidiphilus]